MGYKCLIATSGRDGQKIIDTGDVDIVITDLIMHDVDGLQILKSTKERLPEAEVILITGYGTVETAVDAMQKGAATYLLKPININHLRQRLINSLRSNIL